MAFLSVIRRWALREGISIREITRRTGLSRNTIRKYLRSGAVEAKFKVPKRSSKLDPFAENLSLWLKVEAGKSRKQRRTIKQLQADLAVLVYNGSYGRVAVFSRAWKADGVREAQGSGCGTFVPLAFQPGEAFQFDWSEDWAVSGPCCGLRISSCLSVALSLCVRICCRRTRCCSTPIAMRFGCWASWLPSFGFSDE